MFGSIGNTQSSKELNMQVMKASGRVEYKVSDDYSVVVNGSIAKFLNIEYSETTQEIEAENYYFEGGIGVYKKFNDMSLGLSYDSLNYFVINGELAIAVNTHRVSFKFSKPLFESFSLSASAGYLSSFSDIELSGFDTNLGLTYSFGLNNSYAATLFGYKSSLDNALTGNTDDSTAFGVSLSHSF
jgi:hypothetical protein